MLTATPCLHFPNIDLTWVIGQHWTQGALCVKFCHCFVQNENIATTVVIPRLVVQIASALAAEVISMQLPNSVTLPSCVTIRNIKLRNRVTLPVTELNDVTKGVLCQISNMSQARPCRATDLHQLQNVFSLFRINFWQTCDKTIIGFW